MPQARPPTRRTEVRRLPELARYDRATIDAILDEAWYCHVGFIAEDGGPVVIPTIHVRMGDEIVLHGSPASRLLRSIRGRQVSVAVTLLDGLVLARSVFNHSMQYRSVVLFGMARPIEDPSEKVDAMRRFTDKLLPGRWGDARIPNDREIRATELMAVSIEEASAKVSTEGPADEPDDLDRETWAGVIPLHLAAGTPVPAPGLRPGVDPPPYPRH